MTRPPEPDLANTEPQPHLVRPPWRLFGWGSVATLALAAVAVLSQTDAGKQRLQSALASTGEPARATAPIPPHNAAAEAQIQHLAGQLAELRRDREQLAARVATLEQHIEDMTGSIRKQSEQLAAARAQMLAPPPFVLEPAATAPPQAVAAAPPAEPVGEPVPADLPPLQPLALAPVAQPAQEPAAEPPQPEAKAEAEAEAEPEPVPPPSKVAAAPANEPAAESPPAKAGYAVDLGGASSLQALRYHWAGLKANYGPQMAGLQPLAALHAKHASGTFYRLVAGPLPTEAAAKELCARLPPLRTGCHAAKFAGVKFLEH